MNAGHSRGGGDPNTPPTRREYIIVRRPSPAVGSTASPPHHPTASASNHGLPPPPGAAAAAAAATAPQPGYDAIFDYPDGLDSRYICPVCLAALRNPIQTKCGHRFCKTCFRASVANQRQPRCPVDKTNLHLVRDVFGDLAMEREVLSLAVRCSNFRTGCQWKGELRQLEEHLGRCQEALVFCFNYGCQSVYKRSQHEDHQRECVRRIQPCSHCGIEMLAVDTAKHQLLDCTRFPVTCVLCGQTGIIREDIPKHVDSEQGTCPMSVVACSFATFGCTFKDKRRNLSGHYQASLHDHMLLIKRKVESRETITTTSSSSSNNNCIVGHLSLSTVACRPAANHHSTATTTTTITNSSLAQLEEHMQRLQRLETEIQCALSDLDSNSYDGRLLWKIVLTSSSTSAVPTSTLSTTAAAAAAATAAVIPAPVRSPPFYTGRPGYRVQLILESTTSAGAGSSSATCSSSADDVYCHVTVRLLSGRFDDRLLFPVDGTLKIILINQSEITTTAGNRCFCSTFHKLTPLQGSLSSPSVHTMSELREPDFSRPPPPGPFRDSTAASSSGVAPPATSPAAESDGRRTTDSPPAGRPLRLMKLSELLAGPFSHDGQVFVQAHVEHLILQNSLSGTM